MARDLLRCSCCQQLLPLTAFWRDCTKRARGGRSYSCRMCAPKRPWGTRSRQFNAETAARFLRKLRQTGNVVASIRAVNGPSRDTLYRWRHNYPDFRRDWDLALDDVYVRLGQVRVQRSTIDNVRRPYAP